MDEADFVFVGAGVFGPSTAYHFARSHPGKRIILFDRKRPNPGAASSDYNKIIRADYKDILYAELGLEALESWNNDPIFKPYFHKSGFLMAEGIGMGREALINYGKMGYNAKSVIMSVDETRARFPQFRDAHWDGVGETCFNPDSGWGEADGAIQSLVDAVIAAGVEFLEARVASLAIGEDRSCEGIRVVDKDSGAERTIVARQKTILCVGAYTAKLLADTDPEWNELQVNGRMVAAAAVQCTATYPLEEEAKLIGTPCHFLGIWHTHGEMIPPFNERFKFNCEVSFTNNTYHEGLKKDISVPPSVETQTTFGQDIPEGLKQEVANVVKNTFGNYINGLRIESYRMCWDAVSPNQDWVIDHHPHCKNLFIAGAGSFHGWKFLPNIGKYVVQGIFGELAPEKARKWAWDRPNDGAACEMSIPLRDLKSIGPFKGWPKTIV